MSWLRRNWKWFILPVWAVTIAVVWLFRGRAAPSIVVDPTPKVLDERDSALKALRDRLDEISHSSEEQIRRAEKEQIKEYDTLKDKSLKEVAEWIDKLS